MALCSWYLITQEFTMNIFCEHHQDGIRFGYGCFDRLLLNGLIQPFLAWRLDGGSDKPPA